MSTMDISHASWVHPGFAQQFRTGEPAPEAGKRMQRIYWLQRLLCVDLMAIRCTHTPTPPDATSSSGRSLV